LIQFSRTLNPAEKRKYGWLKPNRGVNTMFKPLTHFFPPALSWVIVAMVAQTMASGNEPSAQWSQWRGPHRTGHIAPSQPWPASIQEGTLQEAWRIELGPSYSSPIVTEEHVFVTETVDKKYEVIRALNRKTGEQAWELRWEGALKVPFFAQSNGSWIRATPVYDNGRLYVAGIRDVISCIDASNGKEVWRVDFVKDHGGEVPDFGFVSSPLIDGDYLYVQAGGGFSKLEKATGKIVWTSLKDGGGMMGSAFSSPVKTEIHGVEQLVVQTRTKLCGVHPEDGKELWSQEVPAFRGMNILTPTVIGDRVFTSSYGGESFLYKINHQAANWSVEQVWANRKQGYMSSPVVIDNHIYLHLRNQRFTCINLETGEDTWTTESFGKYWSLITNGKQILALDERGDLLLIQANPNQFELVESRDIAEAETWAHLGISDRELFVRELNAMVVYRWKDAP
jgi:outer membrane protein assembly factor BamB